MSDPIQSPDHYVKGRQYPPISVLEDWKLCHHKAAALKYIARAGRKGCEIKDLQKAVWYLERKIKLLKQEPSDG
jgi:hypothetical protein